jgi:hypothetical protein
MLFRFTVEKRKPKGPSRTTNKKINKTKDKSGDGQLKQPQNI